MTNPTAASGHPPVADPAGSLARPTRERILDAAETLFAGRGWSGTSIRDIARASGLTPASLYNHFEGKDELYAAVLDRGVRPLLERMRGFGELELTDAAVEGLITGIMGHLARHPHVPRLIYLEALTGGSHLEELTREWIRPLLERGIEEMERGEQWEREEFPLVMTAWLQLLFGPFALAPLLASALDDDPLAPDAVALQTRFLVRLSKVMMDRGPARTGDAGRDEA